MSTKKVFLLVSVLVVIALFVAGCTTQKTDQKSTGSPQAGSAGPAAGSTQAASAARTCPTLASGKGVWDGNWETHLELRHVDGRKGFYPPTQDNPDPWHGSDLNPVLSLTFTQTGCDVTGSLKTDAGCPVSFKGTVDGTNLKGTWKAYCSMAPITAGKDESGTFDIWIEETNNAFAGAFDGSSPDSLDVTTNARERGLNSNFVGKRV